MNELIYGFFITRARDLPVRAEIPAVSPPMSAVITNNNIGDSFLTTSKATLLARICSLFRLIKKAKMPQNNATPKKTDKKLKKRFWGIKYPIDNPAIAIDHQGRKIPRA